MSEDNLYDEPNEVLFRPSYSPTFLYCEAALLDGRFYPDSAGIEAAVGTVFHNIMQEWLNTHEEPRYRLGHVAEVWKQDADREKDKPFLVGIDEDMFYHGQRCVDYLRQFRGRRLVERRVDISFLTPIPNQSGTLDVGFLRRRRAVTIDWKYGTGIKVFAEWNTQQLLYLSGIFKEFDHKYHFENFEIHIAQPRLNHFEKFELTRAELLDWQKWAKERMAAAWKRKNRTYTVGTKQCTWCKRREDCRAKLAHLEKMVDEDFDRFAEPITAKEAREVEVFTPPRSMETAVQRLSLDEKVKLLGYRGLFEKWFKMLYESVLEAGLDGEDTGDFYIGEGRSNRGWKSKEDLIEKVTLLGIPKEELFEPPELLSPNKLSKVLREYGIRGKALEDYIGLFTRKAPGKPTLIRKGEDDRPAIDDYSDVFETED